jgi:predicted DNA-binding transcriptional regulator YafY
MVSERRWHPSQQTKWMGKKEEVLEIVFELSGFEEIRRWILSWGPQVEVLEPKDLRASIAAALDESRKFYAD